MRTNVKTPQLITHEGGRAVAQKPLLELERAVANCLLWENTFYEKGSAIAERIAQLCTQVTGPELATLAIKARNDLKLRHVPLWLVRQMARLHPGSQLVSNTLATVVQRPDELAEFMALYWKDGRQPLSAQVKRGLAQAFTKFSAYQLAKWDRGGTGTVKLKDVLFLSHAKPQDATQAELWAQLIDGTLESADTWERELSAGKDKRLTWERLLSERKLGYMALLMNLRNMVNANVDRTSVEQALLAGARGSKALPFRFVSAAKAAPSYAQALSDAMIAALGDAARLEGSTGLVVDVSGSMNSTLSARGTLLRWEAAAALGVLLREICQHVRVFTFSNECVEVPNVRGIGLIKLVGQSQPHSGTYLDGALEALRTGPLAQVDRLIVITDEQAHDRLTPCWARHGYLVNVAPYEPALDVSQGWTRVSGWSERIVDWIRLEEQAVEAAVEEADA